EVACEGEIRGNKRSLLDKPKEVATSIEMFGPVTCGSGKRKRVEGAWWAKKVKVPTNNRKSPSISLV
ncbi:hypothetical protein HPP92_026228, partial [Vanilla planifolia]